MARRLTRAEVPVEQTWNLDDIFPSVEAWEEEFAALPELINNVTQYKGRLGEGASVLLGCLKALETLQLRSRKVFAYASLNNSVEGTNLLYKLWLAGLVMGTNKLKSRSSVQP